MSKDKEDSVTGEKKKPVRLDLDSRTHRLLRIVAAESGKSMSGYARDVLKQKVDHIYKKLRSGGKK